MTPLLRIGTVLLLVAAAGCLKPQSENPGAQTPAERAVPPKTSPHMVTDGPTQPRTSAARPPKGHEQGDDD